MRLNGAQLAAAQAPERQVLTVAGAGTGKTTMLVARSLWLAERYGRVRLTTFSRRGVRVLRSRLEGAPAALRDRITVETHHGLGRRILRDHGGLIGWAPDWTIIDRAEQDALEREARGQGDLFAARLQRAALRTYDELLPGAVALLRAHPAVADEWSADTAHLVDEAHDSSEAEWYLDRALGQESLTVVGDPAQRIYGWRGAIGMETLGGDWARYALGDNYRSGPAILALANRLPIAGRVDLRAHRAGGTVEQWEGPADEHLVARLLRDDDLLLRPERWAILARTRHRLERVAEWLRGEGIPVHAPCLSAKRWEGPQARRLLDHLHCVANPHASLHLARVLSQAGWTEAQLLDAEFGRADPSRPLSLWEWVCHHADPDDHAADVLRLLATLRTLSDPADGDTGIDAEECARELQRAGVDVGEASPDLRGKSPSEFLDWLADPDRDDGDGAEEACYLGTIHSAKGEEYPTVLVLGLEEGGLPGSRWRTELRPELDRIAEERRLLYVAVTRAEERLILARRTERRVPGGARVAAAPSRFILEIGGAPHDDRDRTPGRDLPPLRGRGGRVLPHASRRRQDRLPRGPEASR